MIEQVHTEPVAPFRRVTPLLPAAHACLDDLSQRERDVLELVAAGLSNAEIADHLFVSANTVKTYIRTAYRKIGAERRSQAVIWAVRNGLLVIPGVTITVDREVTPDRRGGVAA